MALSRTTPASQRPRIGIGIRLVSAFVAIVGLSTVACVVGWIAFAQLAGEFGEVAEDHVPRMAVAAQMSTVGVNINAVVPALASSNNRSDFDRLLAQGEGYLTALAVVIDKGRQHGIDGDDLEEFVALLRDDFHTMQRHATSSFMMVEQMRHLAEELRWVQADFIVEAQPLIDDVTYNIERDIAIASGGASILAENQRGEALLNSLAAANLAVGLLSRVAGVSSEEEMQEALAFLGDSTDDLESSVATLTRWRDSITIRQLAARILQIADYQSGIPALKQAELLERAEMQATVATSQRNVDRLVAQISQEVQHTERDVLEGAARATEAINAGKTWLLGIALVALLSAVLVGYFYVHRNLLHRIQLLAASADDISRGHSGTSIPSPANDELGDLGRALNIFRQTRDELIQAAKLAALGQMATGIAHELNQPLAALRSQAHNAKKFLDAQKPEQAQRSLLKIDELVTRMSGQINHLRRFARLPEARLGPTSLTTGIRDAVSLLQHRFEDDGVELNLDYDQSGNLLVVGEAIRLEQVLVNLLANAIDAVAGHLKRGVNVRIALDGDWVELMISDNGAGIAPADTERVFDPFFTTKPPGSGLGLGLSISYNIVKDFGGSMKVTSSPGAGAVFSVLLRHAA